MNNMANEIRHKHDVFEEGSEKSRNESSAITLTLPLPLFPFFPPPNWIETTVHYRGVDKSNSDSSSYV